MRRTVYSRTLWGVVIAAGFLIGGRTCLSASAAGSGKPQADKSAASPAANLFDSVHAGQLGVQFIPRDSREATLILTNNTDGPLSVRLPDAFAAVPVLAQQQPLFGGPGLNQPGNNNTAGKSKQPQPLSTAGPPTSARGQQGQQPRGGVFSIPPERVVKLKYPVVCLAYGKPEPNAHVHYEIEPIEQFTKSAELQALCRLFSTDKTAQPVAQAAAWHLTNDMSWEKLADLKHFPHNAVFRRPVFTSDQIKAAMALVDKAMKAAEPRAASVATSSER